MSTRRIGTALVLLLSLVLTATACVKSDESTNEVFKDPNGTPGFNLPEQPRIVALGWSDGGIALELGFPSEAIYDWMSIGADTKGVGEWDAAAFGDKTPQLISSQSDGQFNMQQIEELHPDLILNVRAKADPDITSKLSKIAPVVTAPDGTPDYAINWETQTQIIGAALGKRTEADQLIKQTTDLQRSIRDQHPEFEGKKFVYANKFGTAYGAYLPGDSRFDFFTDLGFVENPPISQLQSSGFFAQVPVERVGDLDAQVAVLSVLNLPFSDLENDPLINSLSVVRDGRAVRLPQKDPAIMALSAGTPTSLKFAAERITPQLAEAAAH